MAGIIARDPLFYGKGGRALTPSTVNNGSVDGDAISLDGLAASYITFLLVAGAIGTASALTVGIQAQKRADGNWEALKEYDGTTDLAFTPGKLLNNAEFETSGFLLGSLDLSRVDAQKYKAVRLHAAEGGSVACALAAAWWGSDLLRSPSGLVDDLIEKLRPQSGAVSAA